MEIRSYNESDAMDIADLFHGSVHAIENELYTQAEKEAWAPTPPDYEVWKARLKVKQPFVGMKEGVIVGFIELDSDGHIDCLYVHKNYQGLGIGSELLEHLIHVGRDNGLSSFYTEASKSAEPIFKKYGFIRKSTNEIDLRGQVLINYNMKLSIKP